MRSTFIVFIFYLVFSGLLSAQVNADFKADRTSGCGVLQVKFQNLSTGPITSYQWTLGNSSTSLVPNPSKIYVQAGKYQICLTVKDAAGNQDTECKEEFIKLFPPFQADFAALDTVICAGQESSFQDHSISPNGRIVSWTWDLGGSAGVIQQVDLTSIVTSRYSNGGRYPITLSAVDEVGCLSNVIKNVLHVIEPPTIAINAGSGILCDTIGTINFQNLSPDQPEIIYNWDFGNGQKYNGFNPPAVTYSGKGKYSVTVSATNAATNCSDTVTFIDAITVDNLSSFTHDKDEFCQFDSTGFMSTSLVEVDSHFWDFGDGNTSDAIQPFHAYNIPGCFTVRHRITHHGCTSESIATKCIRVRELPTSDFLIDKSRGCDFPIKVNTTNLSTGAIAWSWTANGIVLSNDQQPVLEFKDEGKFRLGLQSINQYGCSAKFERDTLIAYRIRPIISSDSVHTCAPVLSPFEHKSYSLDPITKVRWILFTPTPKYIDMDHGNLFIADTGKFTVRLIIQNSLGCIDSTDFPAWIRTGTKPITDMTLTNTICYGAPMEGLDKSSLFSNEFEWTIDSIPVNKDLKTAIFGYDDIKTYSITHRALHNGCPGETIRGEVNVIGAKAEFFPALECISPLERQFKNVSIGADSVFWDFGLINQSNDTSSRYSPSFSYAQRGDYPVVLTAFNAASNCRDTSLISVAIREIKAAMELSALKGCAPIDIVVSNKSVDAASYFFQFPESTEKGSNLENPVFNFTSGGKYKGSLVAVDALGCTDTVDAPLLDLYSAKAAIQTNRARFCQDSIMTFLDRSTAQNDIIRQTTWYYSNQMVPNRASIEVRLDSNTITQVELKIETAAGCKSSDTLQFKTNKIESKLIADTVLCNLDTAKFDAFISGQYSSVKWSFGDGNTSRQKMVNHYYKSDGQYSIQLIVSDTLSGCAQTLNYPNLIKVGPATADFDFIGEMINCRPFIGSFTNKSSMADQFTWDLGDQSNISTEINPSHLYTQRGHFGIKLIATSTSRCADTLFIDSLVFVDAPSIQFTPDTNVSLCSPMSVEFNTTLEGARRVLIEYGDGAQDSLQYGDGDQLFRHEFHQSGLFYPVIVVTDSNSCQDFAILDTLQVHTANPKLGFLDTLFCGPSGQIVLFDSAVSSSPILSRQLVLKGNGRDTVFNYVPAAIPINDYGSYTLEYIISNQYCQDTVEYINAIVLSPKPTARFSISQANYCAGDSVLLINGSRSVNVPIDSIFWTLGLFKSSVDTLRRSLSEGTVQAQLIARTAVGCRDTMSMDLDVKPSVFSEISNDTTLCSGSLLTLKAKLLNPVADVLFRWRSGPDILCTGCLDYPIRPSLTSRYTFETIHPNGCIRPYELNVRTTPNTIGNIHLTPDTVLCPKAVLPLSVDVINDVYAYTWDRKRKGLSCYDNCKNPIARPDSTTTYVVSVTNAVGCERLDSVQISIKPGSALDLGRDRTLCKGDELQLNVADLSAPRWSGASGISCTNCTNPILRPVNSSTYAVEGLLNGCPVMDSIKINVLSNDIIVGTNDTTICIGSSLQLKSAVPFNVSWSPSIYLNDPTSPNPVAQPVATITYVLTVHDDLCNTMDSIRVNVLQSTVISSPDRTVCPNDELTLGVQGVATSYTWFGPGILSGQNTSAITIRPKTSVSYDVIARNQTCKPDTQAIRVTVIDFFALKDSITFNAIADLPVKLNKGLNAGKEFKYNWSPPDYLSCTDCEDPVFVGNQNARYSFEVVDPATGCTLTQLVKVDIVETCQAKDFFTVPNVFTPNQDGENDFLFVLPKAADEFRSFRIFDRVGDLIFQTFDRAIGWDGTFRQANAPNGVYVFVLEAECPQTGERIILKGDITLVR